MKTNFRRILPVLVVLLVLLVVFQPFSGKQQNNPALSPSSNIRTEGQDLNGQDLQLLSGEGDPKPDPVSISATGSDSASSTGKPDSEELTAEDELLDEHGSYTTKEDVSLYLLQYGHLPENFITKNEARKLGWEGGSLEKIAPGMCIGGDRFGNREGLLPKEKGRTWTECDINTLGKSSRGAKRLLFSNDGLIYYTDDHYESFTLLYGEP